MVTALAFNLPERVTLWSLAKSALDACGGDRKAAMTNLRELLRNDSRLLNEVVADVIMQIGRNAVSEVNNQTRRRLMTQASLQKDNVIALAAGIGASLLDFPLSCGVNLRDATPDQVAEQIQIYDSKTRDMSHKSRWLRHIIQGVPKDKKVGEVLSSERALELWELTANAE